MVNFSSFLNSYTKASILIQNLSNFNFSEILIIYLEQPSFSESMPKSKVEVWLCELKLILANLQSK